MAKCAVFFTNCSRDLWQNININIHLETETAVVFRHEIKEEAGRGRDWIWNFGNGKKENH